MNENNCRLHDLSLSEQIDIQGGDWWERYMGFIYATAFFAGALAAPELLVVSGMAGAAMLITDYLVYEL